MSDAPKAPRTRAQLEAGLRKVLTFQGLAAPDYAVAAPLVWDGEAARLLLEVRAQGISQAGDPCFPGGRRERGESPAVAAAREFQEELGIPMSPERFLGQLPTVRTYLGGRTDVFVCVLSQGEAQQIRVNPAEVETLLRVPMDFFLARPQASAFQVEGHTIWGMTAGAIGHLCRAWAAAFGV